MEENKNKSEIVLYQSNDGTIKIDVILENESVWLSQEQMGVLFGKSKSTINEHIKNVYDENELEESSTMRKFGNSEFSTKPTNYCNLDVIELQKHIQKIRLSERLDVILQLNGRELLNHAGQISHQMAIDKSSTEYAKFKQTLKEIEKKESIKELEQDIKQLSNRG